MYGENPFIIQKAENQGGYNLPEEFISRLFRLVRNCNNLNCISKKTIQHLKYKMVEFVAKRYLIERKLGFENDYKGSIQIIYSELGFRFLLYFILRVSLPIGGKK